MTPTDLNLRILFWIILFFLGAQSEPLPQQSPEESPVYCIESHPDYDPEKCAAEEDPLHKWRRLQEERAIKHRASEEAEWKRKGCKCNSLPETTENNDDPFEWDYSEKQKCEWACGLKPYPKDESLSVQSEEECNPQNPEYNKEKCETEDPLHEWRRLLEERVAREEKLEGKDCTCLNPIENEDPEDPLHKWRKLQCERVCKDVSKPKQD